jgi:anthranilate phosphoribosyltransferase
VILYAAALLTTAGKAESLREAAALAREVLESGKAGKALDRFVEASNG